VVGEFAGKQRAQHVGDGLSAIERHDLDAAALFWRDVDGEPRGERAGVRFAEVTASGVRTRASASPGRAAKARLALRPLIA
jgi:hypothetical protein